MSKWAIKFEDQTFKDKKFIKPQGFSGNKIEAVESKTSAKKINLTEHSVLKHKKSWEIVVGVLKGIPMNLFMMWMVGNSVQIFSIMMCGMLLLNPVRGILSVATTFEKLEDANVNLWLQKLAFVGAQLLCLGIGLYKCQSMGLLPTTTSDWLSFLEPKNAIFFFFFNFKK
jgi:hypothetical protein